MLLHLIKKIKNNYLAVAKYKAMISFLAIKKMNSSLVDTFLGKLWLVLEPLCRMVIYYFIVVIIFRAGPRFGVNPFIFIMMGLTHFLFLSRAVTLGMNSILSRQKILMQLPIEPLVFICIDFYKSFINFGISFVLYLIFYFYLETPITKNIIFYPFILFIFLILIHNLSIISASLVIIVRDLRGIIPIFMRILMYMSPVIYATEFVPEKFQYLYLFNPFSCIFALLQWSFFGSTFPPTGPIYCLAVFIILIFIFSHYLYNKIKPKFTKIL